LFALSPEDVLPAVYLCTNKIAADHENIVSLRFISSSFSFFLSKPLRFFWSCINWTGA